MFERFTDRARKALLLAQDEARALGHNFIGTEHQLLGLLREGEGEGVAAKVLSEAGLGYDEVREAVITIIGPGPESNRIGDADALASIGIDLDAIRESVADAFGPGALERELLRQGWTGGRPLTARAKKVLDLSLREALSLKHNYIGTEHILLAIVREGEGVAAEVLRRLAGDYDFKARVVEMLSIYGKPRSAP